FLSAKHCVSDNVHTRLTVGYCSVILRAFLCGIDAANGQFNTLTNNGSFPPNECRKRRNNEHRKCRIEALDDLDGEQCLTLSGITGDQSSLRRLVQHLLDALFLLVSGC